MSICLGAIVFLLADVLGTQQFLITADGQLGNFCRSLGFSQIAFCTFVISLIGSGINLIQRITCFNITTFRKITFQDDATHLWTHFSNAVSAGSAG
ncbi:hypothetical protein D3C76_1284170 [compost metagenome]